MRPGKLIDFAFPFVELAQRRHVAIQRRQTTPVFEDRCGQQVYIESAKRRKLFGREIICGTIELIEGGPGSHVIGQAFIHGREAKDILGIVQTPVADIAHERQNDIEILVIDLISVFQPLADQT
jgi:hypothetical protein